MNAKKFYISLIVIIVLLVIATAGVFYGANVMLKRSSTKLSQLKVENAVLEQNEKVYQKAKNDLIKYQDLQSAVNEALPKEKDQAKALKELIQIGNTTGVKIEKIEFTDSTLGDKAKSTASTPAAAGSAVTQAKPIAGISGVQGIEMKVTLAGANTNTSINYNNFIEFLDLISNNRRSMQITSLNIQPDLKKADLTINIFVKP
jgi:hypothetical protein